MTQDNFTKKMAGLSEGAIEKLKQDFNMFDVDGDGTISTEELSNILKSFGDEVTDAAVSEVIKEFDVDGNGEIDFNEFLIMMASKNQKKGSSNARRLIQRAFSRRKKIRETFESFDKVNIVLMLERERMYNQCFIT